MSASLDCTFQSWLIDRKGKCNSSDNIPSWVRFTPIQLLLPVVATSLPLPTTLFPSHSTLRLHDPIICLDLCFSLTLLYLQWSVENQANEGCPLHKSRFRGNILFAHVSCHPFKDNTHSTTTVPATHRHTQHIEERERKKEEKKTVYIKPAGCCLSSFLPSFFLRCSSFFFQTNKNKNKLFTHTHTQSSSSFTLHSPSPFPSFPLHFFHTQHTLPPSCIQTAPLQFAFSLPSTTNILPRPLYLQLPIPLQPAISPPPPRYSSSPYHFPAEINSIPLVPLHSCIQHTEIPTPLDIFHFLSPLHSHKLTDRTLPCPIQPSPPKGTLVSQPSANIPSSHQPCN